MIQDSLGDRVKGYEAAYNHKFTKRTPLIIRVDGKAFHTFTKNCNKPFDQDLINAMAYAAEMTAKEMQGFKLAYVQSDECTFLLTDYDDIRTMGWFDYELNKIVSITASAFTAWFNLYGSAHFDERFQAVPAMFDARAFNVPRDDWQNVFIWRQQDWARNSLQMLSRAHYSHKELEGKNTSDMHELLHEKGINWAELSGQLKNGTFILRDYTKNYDKHTYDTLTTMAGLRNE